MAQSASQAGSRTVTAPPPLADRLARLPDAVFAVDPDTLPATQGAYLLILELARPLRLRIATLGRPELPPGRYCYAGSARGPGGLGARVRRHARPAGPIHWHVDHLARAATRAGFWAVPGVTECALAEIVREIPGARIPVPGFGSSDCRSCPAHLIALDRA